MRAVLLGLAALLSGIAALVYQFLWIRRFGEMFGNTAYAVNIVLAVFFTGLGLGAWLLGRGADRRGGSIGLYCALEIIIAAYGVAFGWLCDGLEGFYLSFAPAEWPLSSSLWFKGAASALLLAVPTIAMGGTLPAILRHAIRASTQVGSRVAWLYGLNTVGAALGVAVSVLFLVPSWGVEGATAAAVATNVAACALAWFGRLPAKGGVPLQRTAPRAADPSGSILSRRRSSVLPLAAALSGFVCVGLEVLWTRALASRFMNTVYSFATIVVVFLLLLGLAALLTSWFDRLGWAKRSTLALVFVAGGLAGLASVAILMQIPSSSGGGLGAQVGVSEVLLRELGSSVAVMALPVLILGLCFPILVRLAHRDVNEVGRETGEVYLANTLGCVAAPLVIGFMALPDLGLRSCLTAVSWIAVLFGVLLVVAGAGLGRVASAIIAGSSILLAVAVQLLLPNDLRLWRSSPRDLLIEYREGVGASIAVLQDESGDLLLKLNSEYRLGSARTAFAQHRQGLIPLLIHPRPQCALFIGLGTGSSAGAAAAYEDVPVDILEIVPELEDLIGHFSASNEHLAERVRATSRVRILSVDGRHYVRATNHRYDVVVGDLFIPWRAGEGAMYTREHLEAVRHVLKPGGVFCQWLPLYQFGHEDFGVVVATFCDVFPFVEAFWLYFNVEQPVIGLVGTNEQLAVDTTALRTRLREPEYAGLLSGAGLDDVGPLLGSWIGDRVTMARWADGARVDTRSRPRIEFSAPIRRATATGSPAASNVLDILSSTRHVQGSALLSGCPEEDRARIQTFQTALGHFFRAGCLGASGSRPSDVLDELVLALRATPAWDWIAWNIEQAIVDALKRKDLETARRGATALQGARTQMHVGYYYAAIIAFQEHDLAAARGLARKGLDLQPGHQATLALIERIDAASNAAGQDGHR